jgi:hypothetical protein
VFCWREFQSVFVWGRGGLDEDCSMGGWEDRSREGRAGSGVECQVTSLAGRANHG